MTTNRRPKKKLNTIACKWAKEDGQPDWCVAWGDGADKGSAYEVVMKIAALGDELAKRGYDRNSLRFEVKKLPTE